MLHNIEGEQMARGESGRIVIEMDPEIKQELYQKLQGENSNLKSWFLSQVEKYLDNNQQLPLQLDGQTPPAYKTDKS